MKKITLTPAELQELKDESLTILTKIESILSDYDCKSYMLKELGHLLPPLNFWDQGIKKLDGITEKVKLLEKVDKIQWSVILAFLSGVIILAIG